MKTLKSILFATDLRSASGEVADVVIRLALAANARVTLLHVLEPIAPLAPTPTAVFTTVFGSVPFQTTFGKPEVTLGLKRVSDVALQDLVARFTAQKVDVAENAMVVGSAADNIVYKADEMDADLIVIGAGDRARFDRFSVGPVAVSVIEHAQQPVLAVRPGEPLLTFRKILCPVDHSAPSARGLRNAIRLARVFGGEIVVLSVIPEISWLSAAVETGQLQDAQAAHSSHWREEFENFLVPIDFESVPVNKDVRLGAPHHQIAAAAKDHQADLIVMGATGRTGLVRMLLGGTTRRMLEELPCSLLTVKREDVVDEIYGDLLQGWNKLMTEARDLRAAGQYEAAIPKLRRILKLTPFHLPTVEALVEAHEKLGQAEQAETYRRRAEQLRPQTGL